MTLGELLHIHRSSSLNCVLYTLLCLTNLWLLLRTSDSLNASSDEFICSRFKKNKSKSLSLEKGSAVFLYCFF